MIVRHASYTLNASILVPYSFGSRSQSVGATIEERYSYVRGSLNTLAILSQRIASEFNAQVANAKRLPDDGGTYF